MNYGWICPNCKQGIAPFVKKCTCVPVTRTDYPNYPVMPTYPNVYPILFYSICPVCGKLNCTDLHITYTQPYCTTVTGTGGTTGTPTIFN
jgi:hypothetical protein